MKPAICMSVIELRIAPPRTDLTTSVGEFLRHETGSRFRRYAGLSAYLDDVFYQSMVPFITTMP